MHGPQLHALLGEGSTQTVTFSFIIWRFIRTAASALHFAVLAIAVYLGGRGSLAGPLQYSASVSRMHKLFFAGQLHFANLLGKPLLLLR